MADGCPAFTEECTEEAWRHCLFVIAKPILTTVFQVKKTLEADIWDNGQAETESFGLGIRWADAGTRWDVGCRTSCKCSKLSDAFRRTC